MIYRRWFSLIAALVMGLTVTAGAQTPTRRVALIISNANYVGYTRLPNTATDAGLVRETLRRAGFSPLDLRPDLDAAGFRAALDRLRAASDGADVAVVYFAGHGVEVAGRNYLIPVDAALASEADLIAQTIDVDDIFAAMSGARMRIAVLDACRDNPFDARLRASGARTLSRGLVAPNARALSGPTRPGPLAQGALLMYSAAPGTVADDGPQGQGSPFARAFQRHFAEPDLELRVAVGKIADAVAAETASRQVPFTTMSLSGRPFVLVVNAERRAPRTPMTAGATFRDCAACPQMVVVPRGSFVMGSPVGEAGRQEDEVQRTVAIEAPFALGKYEVTLAEWNACVASGGCTPEDDPDWKVDTYASAGPQGPVFSVSWWDAQRYIRWLNKQVGGTAYRLPSDAEWEYAARAGSKTAYPWGAQASHERANYGIDQPTEQNCCVLAQGRDRWRDTSPVGAFLPNAFGLHDMHGNVAEWVSDCHEFYNSTEGCGFRVIRGGSYFGGASVLRSASRSPDAISNRNSLTGFRVARTLSIHDE